MNFTIIRLIVLTVGVSFDNSPVHKDQKMIAKIVILNCFILSKKESHSIAEMI